MTRPRIGRTARVVAGTLSATAALTCVCATAFAQQPAPPAEVVPAPPAAPGAPPAAEPAPPPAPTPPPAIPPPPAVVVAPVREPAEPAHAASDLDVEARRWAIGYAGISQVPIGLAAAGANTTVPAVGLRYWASETTGVDVALGLGWAGGSISTGATSMDKNDVFGFVLQAGMPLALSTHRHVSFQVIPSIAFARGQTSTGTGVSKTNLHGTRFDVGMRAGFELFFGFIGIPELALSATVGVQFERLEYDAENGGITQSDTTLGLTTTVQNNPWDIFAGNVAARYYF